MVGRVAGHEGGGHARDVEVEGQELDLEESEKCSAGTSLTRLHTIYRIQYTAPIFDMNSVFRIYSGNLEFPVVSFLPSRGLLYFANFLKDGQFSLKGSPETKQQDSDHR